MDLKIGDKVRYRDTAGNTSGVADGELGTVMDFEDGSPIVQWHGKYRRNLEPIAWREESLIPEKWLEQLKGN